MVTSARDRFEDRHSEMATLTKTNIVVGRRHSDLLDYIALFARCGQAGTAAILSPSVLTCGSISTADLETKSKTDMGTRRGNVSYIIPANLRNLHRIEYEKTPCF